jgi:uncharacterized pyridoxamine 5'-phosphate oxidase family protein
MNRSQQGTVGETRVMYELAKNGYPVFREISDTSKTDIITIVNGKCIRIQCKCINSDTKGAISIPLESRTSNTVYTKDDFEILAVYVLFLDKLIFLNWKDIGNTQTLTFRYKPGEGKQKNNKNIRLLDNFIDLVRALES